MAPEPEDENLRDAFRRSLYGSVLIVGIALTILGFDLMTSVTTEGLIYIGGILMVVSIIILPFTVMLLYYGPWLMKEAGLFHLDKKDRSLSNVGDDVEDILEFFAGVDIILVWIELALSVGIEALWVPVLIIIIAIGPLFSIMLNFTVIFVFVKKRATLSMMEYLSDRFQVPDMATSPGYIRSQVLLLIEHQFFKATPTSTEASDIPDDENAIPASKDGEMPPPPRE